MFQLISSKGVYTPPPQAAVDRLPPDQRQRFALVELAAAELTAAEAAEQEAITGVAEGVTALDKCEKLLATFKVPSFIELLRSQTSQPGKGF
jgi:hypothetical protein